MPAARPERVIECEVTREVLEEAEPYDAVVPYRMVEEAASLVVQVMVAEELPGVSDDIEEMLTGVFSVMMEIEEVA